MQRLAQPQLPLWAVSLRATAMIAEPRRARRSPCPKAASAVVLFLALPLLAAGAENELAGNWAVDVPAWPDAGASRASRYLAMDANAGSAHGLLRITFKVGCNSFGGRASVRGERIAFHVENGTSLDCPPALIERDRDFVRRLEAVASFKVRRPPGAPSARIGFYASDGSHLMTLHPAP
jgi:hypothetical protein